MPEYLFVNYALPRRVLVDGVDQGPVCELLEFEAGQHSVRLAGPTDFNPDPAIIWLVNTGPLDPLVVSFTPK
jgi:hypothetical protein